MNTKRFAGASGVLRGVPAIAAALVIVAAAGGPAAVAAQPGGAKPLPGGPAAGVISTLAGGVGGPARATSVGLSPCGVSFGAGHLYIADNSSVREVTPGTDRLTTPAGTGAAGALGDGGRATTASLAQTCGVAVDHSGNLVIADPGHVRVRVVAHSTGTFYGQPMTAGDIYTVAGNGTSGFSGDGGPATKAKLAFPDGVAVDAAGNLLFSDPSVSRIRAVAAQTGTFYGISMKAGDIYTVAGAGRRGFFGDGGPATGALINIPEGVAVDAAGNLVIADSNNNRIRVVAASTGTFYGQAMTAGDIYTVAGRGTRGFFGDRGPATKARLSIPAGVAVDAAGNLVIADTGNNRIRVVASSTGTFYGKPMTAGDIYTIAGNGTQGFSGDAGPATKAELDFPERLAVDPAGNLLLPVNGRVRVVAHSTGTFYDKPMTAGDIYTIAGNGTSGFSGDGGPATHAELNLPREATVDAAGNLVIADTGNNQVRAVARRTGTFYGQAMTAGDIYTIAGDGTQGFAGDGGPATSAELSDAQAVAVDAASGNLLITDYSRVRVVAGRTGTFYGRAMTAGDIYTVAGDGTQGFAGDGGPGTSAELDFPDGVAVDAAGNVLIADSGNSRVRVVAASTGTFYGQAMTAGDIYTIAGTGTDGFSGDGGPATSAELNFPDGVAADAAGNPVIADSDNNRVRVVAASTGTFYGQAMTAGDIYTVAGTGTSGFSGDGGPATSAELGIPQAVAVGTTGDLLISDLNNGRIRVVAASTGTFYGQAMTAGDIYTVAGTGIQGFSGDGGPATSAELSLSFPAGVAVDAAGNLLIADDGNNRIRMVTR